MFLILVHSIATGSVVAWGYHTSASRYHRYYLFVARILVFLGAAAASQPQLDGMGYARLAVLG